MSDDGFAFINGKQVATESHIDELQNEIENLRDRVDELESRLDD